MLLSVRQKFHDWVERRIPASDQLTLRHRQTFILPTRYGYSLLVIIILMLIAAINYQNSMAFLLTFTLLAVGHNTLIYTYRNITGLTLSALKAGPTFAGSELAIPVKITADGREHTSVGVGTRESIQAICDIPATEHTNVEIRVPVYERGYYTSERLYIATTYPLGLLRAWSWFRFEQRYLVYPEPIEPPVMEARGKGDEQGDSEEVKMGEQDFFGIRSYREGDPKRKIHWRAYARELGLHTMEFSEPENQSIHFDFDALPQADTETRLSWLTHLLLNAEASGQAFGLILPNETIDVSSGTQHLETCLRALALYPGARHA